MISEKARITLPSRYIYNNGLISNRNPPKLIDGDCKNALVLLYIFEYTSNKCAMLYKQDLKWAFGELQCYKITLTIVKNFIEGFDSIKFTDIVDFSYLKIFQCL